MTKTKFQMGMHITVEVIDKNVTLKDIEMVYDYFASIEEKFSMHKVTSEISKINNGVLRRNQSSPDMRKVLALCEQTRKETNGYFDMYHNGRIDPTGIVKGWAIRNAAELLRKNGFKNYYVDAGGDVQTAGKNKEGKPWRVGIQNPFNSEQVVKIIHFSDRGIATSGTAVRGQHIYNPHKPGSEITDIISMTVIGPDVLEADRFATAAFAMGRAGIYYIEDLRGFEGYMINKHGTATYTSGFDTYAGTNYN